MSLSRFLIRRLILTIPVLVGVATLVFALIHLVLGGLVQSIVAERLATVMCVADPAAEDVEFVLRS